MSERDAFPKEEFDRDGIERITADNFLWCGYRYSSTSNALAAARRNSK